MVHFLSRAVPHRGFLTPLHSHLTPMTVFSEKSLIFERTNGNAVNYTKSLRQFFFMTKAQRALIASKIGFTVDKLDSFLLPN